MAKQTPKKKFAQQLSELAPSKKIIVFSILDILFAYGIPILLIATKYDLFRRYADSKLQGTGLLYILVVAIVGGLIWRGKELLKLTNKKGLSFALTKSIVPFIFLLFFFLLGYAKDHIDKLRFIALGSSISNFIAIYFRYQIGKAAEAMTQVVPHGTPQLPNNDDDGE